MNDIKGIEALKKQLILTKLYTASQILILHSSKEIKNSKDYKQLAHNRSFNDKIKLVLTTSLIDEGLSIEQKEFTDIVFIETDYSPRPEFIKQFFARFRNIDSNRKNYLYLRTKDNQDPTRYNPKAGFKNTLHNLTNESTKKEERTLKSSYNSLFSNDYFYYDNREINKYFLAYTITDNLFRYLNNAQFKDYLESNYNLLLSNNSDYEFKEIDYSIEREYRKEVKQIITNVWRLNKESVFEALAVHSLSQSIRKTLTVSKKGIDQTIESLVIKEIKTFEQLYKKYNKLKDLGVKDPDLILITQNADLSYKLTVDKKYNQKLNLLKLEKTLFEPKNNSDKNISKRFLRFVDWCKNKREFNNSQMYKKLRSLGVQNSKAFNESNIFTILKWFDLLAKKNKHNQLINVSNINGG